MKDYLLFILLFCMKIVSSYNPSFSASLIHGQFSNDHENHDILMAAKKYLLRHQIRSHLMKNQSVINDLLKTATDGKFKDVPAYRRTFKLAGNDYSLQEILNAHNEEDPIMQEFVDKLSSAMEKERIPIISDQDSSKIDLNNLCGAAGYINRDFYEYSSMIVPSKPNSDSASKFAESLLKHIHKSILISGEKGSGKTVTLVKILSELRASITPNWSFMVDIAKAVPTSIPSNWKPEDILLSVLNDKQIVQFKSILVSQPWNVNILVDNIDRAPTHAADRLLEYFKNLNLNGTAIIMTSTQRFEEPVLSGQGQVSIRIRDLSTQEIENLLVKLWTVEFPSSAGEKISDYAKAVADVLLKTNIPRTIGAMEKLGNLLLTGDNQIFTSEKEFISVKKYINDVTLNLRDIVNVLDTVELNKLQLFDKLTETSDYLDEFYGHHALTNLLDFNSKNYKLLKSLQRESDLWYSNDKTKIEPLLQRVFNEVKTFFHPEHKNYFAAKYIVYHIKSHSNPLFHVTKLILANSKYFAVAEYLNAAIAIHGSKLFKPLFKYITQNSDILHKTLDNAITYRLDNIASGLFKEVNNIQDIQAYFNDDPKHATISSTMAYTFGMLFNTYIPVAGNRQEMLFHQNMETTIETLTTIDDNRKANEKTVWILNDFPSYLKYGVLSQQKPNKKLYTFIMDRLTGVESTEFYNDLLFRVVKYALWDSRHIAMDLQSRGATPRTINVRGETLIHLALKSLNLNLLKFLVEQLNIPIKETPTVKSFLITILDANPLNQYSSPQFWETMEYLIANGEFKVPQPSEVSKLDRSTDVGSANMMSTGYDLVAGTEDLTTFGKIISKLRLSSQPFENLSSDERSYRRNLILLRKSTPSQSDKLGKTTLTEVLLKFRGLDALTGSEEAAYERSIYAAFKFDTKNGRVSSHQVSRIVSAFVDNVATTEDVNFAKTFSKTVLMKTNKKQGSKLLNLLDSQMQTLINSPFDQYVKKGALQARSELQHPPIAWFQPNFEMISEHSARSSNQKLQRSRRAAVRCLVDKSEYEDAVTTTEENGQKTRTLNSEKFIKLFEKDKNRIRNEQLKDLGRRLLNEKSTTIIGNEAELKKMVYGHDIPMNIRPDMLVPIQDSSVPSISGSSPSAIVPSILKQQLEKAIEPVSGLSQIQNGHPNVEGISNSNEHGKFLTGVDPNSPNINQHHVVDKIPNKSPELYNHAMNEHHEDVWPAEIDLTDLPEDLLRRVDEAIKHAGILEIDHSQTIPQTSTNLNQPPTNHYQIQPNPAVNPINAAQFSNLPAPPNNAQPSVSGPYGPMNSPQPTVNQNPSANQRLSPGEMLQLQLKRISATSLPNDPSTFSNSKRSRTSMPWSPIGDSNQRSVNRIAHQTNPSSTITQFNNQNTMMPLSNPYSANSNPTAHANDGPIPQQWSSGYVDPLNRVSQQQNHGIQQISPNMGHSPGLNSYQTPYVDPLLHSSQGMPTQFNVPPVGPAQPSHDPNYYNNHFGIHGMGVPMQGGYNIPSLPSIPEIVPMTTSVKLPEISNPIISETNFRSLPTSYSRSITRG